MEQAPLFDLPDELPVPPERLPPGLRYEAEFLSREEEAQLLALVATLPLEAAKYKAWVARRRVVSYGGAYDYDANKLRPAEPLHEALHPLRARVAAWMGVAPEALVHALVAEYAPGTPLGWHRDVPEFEDIAGLSLGSSATLRLRPYPPVDPKRGDLLRLEAAPRSIYLLHGAARWGWQHSVAPVPRARWSITFRTKRAAAD